ncbi:MAG: hypothetical protein OXK21_03870 [Chloroflexota bacterium]|nr:hypothetical protein [Chloroflexota bacterium]
MVKETRIIFSTSDILAVRIQCKACGGVTLYQFGQQLLPPRCAVCSQDWTSMTDPFYTEMRGLLRGLKHLRDAEASSPVTLLYEIDGDADLPENA